MLYVGFLLELAGLIITTRGLLTTWRANTAQPFFPPVGIEPQHGYDGTSFAVVACIARLGPQRRE